MRLIFILCLTLSAAALSLSTSPAFARKSCWVDHYHYGGGSGKTRRQARREAIAAWQGFVAWEYGADWGHFSRAKNRRVTCSGSRGNYNCEATAIPCHRR